MTDLVATLRHWVEALQDPTIAQSTVSDIALFNEGCVSEDIAKAADEIVKLRNSLDAPLSSEENRLIDKHCDWVAFRHAWNAVMKRRREALSRDDIT